MRYSILVVAHNHADVTRACLDSVFRHSPAGQFEVLAVDNASTDGTREALQAMRDRHGNFRLFLNSTNQGFMSPMNFLASQARGDFLVLLNNDLQVCARWLERMASEFEGRPRLALVGLAQNCGEIGPDGNGIMVKSRLEYVEASCMMVPRRVVEENGLFDDGYYSFAYYEDSDLSLRLRERGYEIATVRLPIVHRRATTSRTARVDVEGHRLRNAELFRRRWGAYLRRRTFEKQVLFRRSGAFGDVIMATPVLRAYKERFPMAQVSFATRCPDVLAGNPDVARVIDLNSWRADPGQYDEFVDLDLAYERRPHLNVMAAYADEAGVRLNGHRPRLFAAGAQAARERVAVIHAERIPGWPGRSAPAAAFEEAAAGLKRLGFRAVEVGSSRSLSCTEYGRTDFPALCSLIARASLFVGQDSGPFHVAQAYRVPAVVAFGSILPQLRDCSGRVFPVRAEGLGCLGCHHIQEPPRTTERCLRARPLCMEAITGKMVWQQVERALEEVKDA